MYVFYPHLAFLRCTFSCFFVNTLISFCLLLVSFFFFFFSDGFGDKGKPAPAGEDAVPPNANLQITLELVSWKTVSEITDDKKVIKKILKEGEGYERPNEGAVVICEC